MEPGIWEEKPIQIGPWGGPGGSKWATDLNGAVGVDGIIIRHGDAVDSLVFKIARSGAGSPWSQKIGGKGGDRTDKVNFDWPDEVLSSIEGKYGSFKNGGPVVVRLLKFITNKAMYGPFGRDGGTSFDLPVTDGKIVGFHGRSGQYVDAVGVCLRALGSGTPVFSDLLPHLKECTIKESAVVDVVSVHSPLPRWPSLYGGVGGCPWDDGVFSGVKSITVQRDEDAIHSVLIEYDKNGKSVFSARHGGNGGEIQNRIIFVDYPKEHLVTVSGFYGLVEGSAGFEIIKSLTFYTNKGKYGPLGKEIGKFFSAGSNGKIVGFLGRNGAYLDALGIHMEFS